MVGVSLAPEALVALGEPQYSGVVRSQALRLKPQAQALRVTKGPVCARGRQGESG